MPTFTTETKPQTMERNNIALTCNTPPAGCDQHAAYNRPVDVFAPFNYLTNLGLIIEIERAIAGNETVIAIGLKKHIQENTPAAFILKEMREMIIDNPDMMADMLGASLAKNILNS